MKKICLLFFTLFLLVNLFAQTEITEKELSKSIKYLASPELKGRKPGTKEMDEAANYIQKEFKKAGLKLIGNNGFQTFDLITKIEPGKNNELSFGETNALYNKDFVLLNFSGNGKLTEEVVFVGYGFIINQDSLKWNDYANIDVNGKWVMILRGDPELDKNNSVFVPYSKERSKVLSAKDKGAKGVIFVSPVAMEKDDKLMDFPTTRVEATSDIPVFQITRAFANKILASSDKKISDFEKELNSTHKPLSFNIKIKITGSSELLQIKTPTSNVVAMVEGNDDILKNEYIVIGAHYDHLGLGGRGSGSRVPDTSAVHYGADDNASGVAAIIEIAQKIAANKKNLKRSVVFVAFTAEELGLIGSKYFTKNPIIDLKKVRIMLNLDMVGRFDTITKYLLIGGSGTAAESEMILKKYNEKYNFKLSLSPEGFGSSDHASFYSENIPVLFFNSGIHSDYHTPSDNYEKINISGQKKICDFVYDLAIEFINRTGPITFQETGSKDRTTGRTGLKVTLGIMPGFGGEDGKGLRVDGVTKGRPADLAGIKKGDVITAINGEKITNVYDYMDRLKKLNTGMNATIDLIRDGKKIVVLVHL